MACWLTDKHQECMHTSSHSTPLPIPTKISLQDCITSLSVLYIFIHSSFDSLLIYSIQLCVLGIAPLFTLMEAPTLWLRPLSLLLKVKSVKYILSFIIINFESKCLCLCFYSTSILRNAHLCIGKIQENYVRGKVDG